MFLNGLAVESIDIVPIKARSSKDFKDHLVQRVHKGRLGLQVSILIAFFQKLEKNLGRKGTTGALGPMGLVGDHGEEGEPGRDGNKKKFQFFTP
jgi:hypothetical protein